MDLNFLFFPCPQSKIDLQTYGNEQIWIPKKKKRNFLKVQKLSKDFKQNIGPKLDYNQNNYLSGIKTKQQQAQQINNNDIFQNNKYSTLKESQYLDSSNINDESTQNLLSKSQTSQNYNKIDQNQQELENLQNNFGNKISKDVYDMKTIAASHITQNFRDSTCIHDNSFVEQEENQLQLKQKVYKPGYYSQQANTSQTVIKTTLDFDEEYASQVQADQFFDSIPCLLLDSNQQTDQIVIFFHGNGEDIYNSYELASFLRKFAQVRVLCVEYPNYGIYKGTCTAEQIQEDALEIYDYLVNQVGYQQKDIIVIGRSIGGGPATYLGVNRQPGALILMAVFTSILGVVESLVGSWATWLVNERFNNLAIIDKVQCPILFIHGKKDTMIPYEHAQKLYDQCEADCQLLLVSEMNHVEFDFELDFGIPIVKFFNKYKLSNQTGQIYKFPSEVYYSYDVDDELDF